MLSQKNNQWNLIPQYDKEGSFLGYALKDRKGQFVQKENAKGRLIISLSSKAVEFKTNDGCPEGCIIRYKGNIWHVTDEQLRTHMAAQIIYVPKMKEGKLTGYEVKQQGKTLGLLTPQDVVYEDNKSGGKDVSWIDAHGNKRFIEKITAQQFDTRTKEGYSSPTVNQRLSESGQRIDSLEGSRDQNRIQEITSQLKKDHILVY